jgi:hypothetical protein
MEHDNSKTDLKESTDYLISLKEDLISLKPILNKLLKKENPEYFKQLVKEGVISEND